MCHHQSTKVFPSSLSPLSAGKAQSYCYITNRFIAERRGIKTTNNLDTTDVKLKEVTSQKKLDIFTFSCSIRWIFPCIIERNSQNMSDVPISQFVVCKDVLFFWWRPRGETSDVHVDRNSFSGKLSSHDNFVSDSCRDFANNRYKSHPDPAITVKGAQLMVLIPTIMNKYKYFHHQIVTATKERCQLMHKI